MEIASNGESAKGWKKLTSVVLMIEDQDHVAEAG